MKKQLLLLVFATLLLSRVYAQLTPFMEGRLQFTLDSVCNRFKYKGVTAAVLIPDQGIWKGTYGYSHESVRITPDMAFGMGSNTKTFICALLLKMQENNLLSLDDTIGTWITGYPNINGSATIRQCLNHTSGIAEYFSAKVNDSLFTNPNKIWIKPEILTLADTPEFAPGEGWTYSNSNYIIAGMIIESVLDKPVNQAMREWILDSAGFNHTFFYGEPNDAPMPHQWTMNLTGTSLVDMNEFELNLLPQLYSLATTAGAMFTTAEENVLFWSKLASGQLLSSQSMAEMMEWVSVTSNLSYGLGIFLNKNYMNGRTIIGHGGTYLGSITENMVDTLSGITVSVLTNQDSLGNAHVANNIMRALHRTALRAPAVGIADADHNGPLQLYPNPANTQVWITADAVGSTVRLMDLQGRLVIAQTGINTLNVATVPNGVYIIQLDKDGYTYHQRLVVQHD
ncbi:MAG: serine hydrolase [Bacteroidia bacterium]|jgi:D-alanyl-D-alanine carboxypeptidase|nr:serine hydrolase [Bacteroidia bacterium]